MAERELIVSSGTVTRLGSPGFRRGLGRRSRIPGVNLVHELKGAGENFRILFRRVVAKVKNSITINELARGPLIGQLARWATGRPNIPAIVLHSHLR